MGSCSGAGTGAPELIPLRMLGKRPRSHAGEGSAAGTPDAAAALGADLPGQEWYRRKLGLQHRAGVLVISYFTVFKGHPITVAGEVLKRRLLHFRQPFLGSCHVVVIHRGESFVALSESLQSTLVLCGGVPAEHHTDSLSACFRNRDGSYAGDCNSRYRELCAHLGMIATRKNRGVAHENGAIKGPAGTGSGD